jgi:ribosomal protein S18 acetylase RimI-like enzyme
VASDWQIREGGRDDLPELERAWRALYAHHAEVRTAIVPTIPADDRWPARLREFEEAFDSDRAVMLVAERDGELVGFAFSTLHGADKVFATGPVGELDVLVVLPEQRGAGIGEELVHRSCAALRERGAATLKVVVMAGNDDALRFYARLGIQPALVDLLAPLEGTAGESG